MNFSTLKIFDDGQVVEEAAGVLVGIQDVPEGLVAVHEALVAVAVAAELVDEAVHDAVEVHVGPAPARQVHEGHAAVDPRRFLREAVAPPAAEVPRSRASEELAHFTTP